MYSVGSLEWLTLQNHCMSSWITIGRKELKWAPVKRAAFERLKEQVVSPPSLYLPDFSRPFVLVTDASGVGTGAILAQRDQLQPQGPLKPIAFFHHTLSSAGRNYSNTDRELLAIVIAVKKFRVYLAGNRFDLITDHRSSGKAREVAAVPSTVSI